MAIIDVKNLSKKYLIYHQALHPADSLREAISNKGRDLFSMLNPYRKKPSKVTQGSHEEFWAVKDVNFSIEEGDKVGIIGRNGAGKSTLLKILSRIVEPTSGQVKIRGRIASLLEVGTGFHPDLSGRENIFLNGALLGMSHQEIKSKFDEIVAFGEIEQFLDTPVKRYSSGMYARLGFAIAAHLETDILIVDEVLSVGDAQFQEKCLKKMNKMGASGRTILFVSHNIGAVTTLCNRGIFLERGKVVVAGDIEDCVNKYMSSCPTASLSWQGDIGDEHVRIRKASVNHAVESSKDYFCQGDVATLEVEYEVFSPQKEWVLGFGIWNVRHQMVARSRLNDLEKCQQALATPGRHRAVFHLDSSLFHEGEYLIKIDCSLSHKKPIIIDDILLKFPIYPQNRNSTYNPNVEREGISLGNKWSLNLNC